MVYRNYAGTLLFQGMVKSAGDVLEADKFKVTFSIKMLIFKEQRYQMERVQLKFMSETDRKAFLAVFKDSL